MAALTREEMEELLRGAARILGTKSRPLAVPGEAILGIEAAARCCGGPGRRFLNLVNGPYGKDFGMWLRETGADVEELEVPYNQVFSAEAVEKALDRVKPQALSYVYTEAVTGGRNPAEKIQAAARRAGAVTIVDAVSSIGADPFAMDDWGVDIAAMGLQKALLGSNGLSFLGVSERAMAWMRSNPAAPFHSQLSLPELFDLERREVPAFLPVLEAKDALRAFREIEETGGPEALVRRHREMAERVRTAVKHLEYRLYQEEEAGAGDLNTTVRRPRNPAADAFREEGIVTSGSGELERELLRINHYGVSCTEEDFHLAMKTLKKLIEAGSQE